MKLESVEQVIDLLKDGSEMSLIYVNDVTLIKKNRDTKVPLTEEYPGLVGMIKHGSYNLSYGKSYMDMISEHQVEGQEKTTTAKYVNPYKWIAGPIHLNEKTGEYAIKGYVEGSSSIYTPIVEAGSDNDYKSLDVKSFLLAYGPKKQDGSKIAAGQGTDKAIMPITFKLSKVECVVVDGVAHTVDIK